MGVTIPNFSAPSPEDNINLGEKDSIRRRALLALEGRTEVGAFARVEIPELGTPEIEKQFNFRTSLRPLARYILTSMCSSEQTVFPPGYWCGVRWWPQLYFIEQTRFLREVYVHVKF